MGKKAPRLSTLNEAQVQAAARRESMFQQGLAIEEDDLEPPEIEGDQSPLPEKLLKGGSTATAVWPAHLLAVVAHSTASRAAGIVVDSARQLADCTAPPAAAARSGCRCHTSSIAVTCCAHMIAPLAACGAQPAMKGDEAASEQSALTAGSGGRVTGVRAGSGHVHA